MTLRALKPALLILGLLPAAWLLFAAFDRRLGAEPIQVLAQQTGLWAFRFLLLTLAATPARRLLGWSWAVGLRRMLGLFCYFYAVLHVTVYVALDLGFAWQEVVADIVDRPFITVGMTTLLLLTPLAVTSTRGWQRRLGTAWKRLHRLVYAAAIGVAIHFLWAVKADLREPLLYAALLALLLGLRLGWRTRPAGRNQLHSRQ